MNIKGKLDILCSMYFIAKLVICFPVLKMVAMQMYCSNRCIVICSKWWTKYLSSLISYSLQRDFHLLCVLIHYIRVIQKYDNFIRTTEYKFIIRNAESQGDFKSCSSSFHCLVFLINVVLGIQGLRNIYLLRIILNVAWKLLLRVNETFLYTM